MKAAGNRVREHCRAAELFVLVTIFDDNFSCYGCPTFTVLCGLMFCEYIAGNCCIPYQPIVKVKYSSRWAALSSVKDIRYYMLQLKDIPWPRACWRVGWTDIFLHVKEALSQSVCLHVPCAGLTCSHSHHSETAVFMNEIRRTKLLLNSYLCKVRLR